MTPTELRPPRPAKSLSVRAAVALLVAAVIALGLGGLMVLMALLLPQMADQAEVRQVTDQLGVTVADLQRMAVIVAVLLAAYTVAALALGVGLLAGGGRAWRRAALVFCGVAGGLLALMTANAVAGGSAGGGVIGLVLIVPNALAIWWLLGTPAAAAPAVRVAVPTTVTPYRPMQDYYTPPSLPERHAGG